MFSAQRQASFPPIEHIVQLTAASQGCLQEGNLCFDSGNALQTMYCRTLLQAAVIATGDYSLQELAYRMLQAPETAKDTPLSRMFDERYPSFLLPPLLAIVANLRLNIPESADWNAILAEGLSSPFEPDVLEECHRFLTTRPAIAFLPLSPEPEKTAESPSESSASATQSEAEEDKVLGGLSRTALTIAATLTTLSPEAQKVLKVIDTLSAIRETFIQPILAICFDRSGAPQAWFRIAIESALQYHALAASPQSVDNPEEPGLPAHAALPLSRAQLDHLWAGPIGTQGLPDAIRVATAYFYQLITLVDPQPIFLILAYAEPNVFNNDFWREKTPEEFILNYSQKLGNLLQLPEHLNTLLPTALKSHWHPFLSTSSTTLPRSPADSQQLYGTLNALKLAQALMKLPSFCTLADTYPEAIRDQVNILSQLPPQEDAKPEAPVATQLDSTEEAKPDRSRRSSLPDFIMRRHHPKPAQPKSRRGSELSRPAPRSETQVAKVLPVPEEARFNLWLEAVWALGLQPAYTPVVQHWSRWAFPNLKQTLQDFSTAAEIEDYLHDVLQQSRTWARMTGHDLKALPDRTLLMIIIGYGDFTQRELSTLAQKVHGWDNLPLLSALARALDLLSPLTLPEQRGQALANHIDRCAALRREVVAHISGTTEHKSEEDEGDPVFNHWQESFWLLAVKAGTLDAMHSRLKAAIAPLAAQHLTPSEIGGLLSALRLYPRSPEYEPLHFQCLHDAVYQALGPHPADSDAEKNHYQTRAALPIGTALLSYCFEIEESKRLGATSITEIYKAFTALLTLNQQGLLVPLASQAAEFHRLRDEAEPYLAAIAAELLRQPPSVTDSRRLLRKPPNAMLAAPLVWALAQMPLLNRTGQTCCGLGFKGLAAKPPGVSRTFYKILLNPVCKLYKNDAQFPFRAIEAPMTNPFSANTGAQPMPAIGETLTSPSTFQEVLKKLQRPVPSSVQATTGAAWGGRDY